MITEMINTTLQAVIEISDQKNTILVSQGGKPVLSELNSFKVILNPEFEKYHNCYVKNIRASMTGLIIDIETPEEREETERIKNWENERNELAAAKKRNSSSTTQLPDFENKKER